MSDSPHMSPGGRATAAAPSPFLRGITEWLRRFYWMEEQMALALQAEFVPGSPGYGAYQMAQAAFSAAARLGDADELEAGRLLLLRTSVLLFSRAALARAGKAVDPPPPELHSVEFDLARAAVRAAEHLRELDEGDPGVGLLYAEASELFARAHRPPAEGVLPPAVAGLSQEQEQRLVAALAVDGASRLAAESREARQATTKLLEKAAASVAKPLRADATGVGRVWWSRGLRFGITAVVLLAVPVVWLGREMTLLESNQALHRPVTTSSTFVRRSVTYDPNGVVDGDTQNIGFHTERGGPQYVTIDLESMRSIHRIVVYNRTDCCTANAVPLRVEVSTDGKHYRQMAERSRNFEVWKVTLPSVDTRYVRLVSTSGTYFHLAEIEVF